MPFYVDVKSEPKGFSQGRRFLCEIQNRELVLKKGKETIEIPVGIHAHSLEKNRLEVQIDDYTIELTIAKLGYYQNQLADDLVSFLNGEMESPVLSDYRLPWYFFVISVLPIGIPIITLGGAIPGAAGAALVMACLGVSQNDNLSIPARLAITIGIVIASYAVFFTALKAAIQAW
jgi:hypothetical protein